MRGLSASGEGRRSGAPAGVTMSEGYVNLVVDQIVDAEAEACGGPFSIDDVKTHARRFGKALCALPAGAFDTPGWLTIVVSDERAPVRILASEARALRGMGDGDWDGAVDRIIDEKMVAPGTIEKMDALPASRAGLMEFWARSSATPTATSMRRSHEQGSSAGRNRSRVRAAIRRARPDHDRMDRNFEAD